MNKNIIKTHERLASIEAKVDGVNRRLDLLNGSTAKNAKRIRSLEDNILVVSGKDHITQKLKSFLYLNGVTIVVAVLTAYIIYKLDF